MPLRGGAPCRPACAPAHPCPPAAAWPRVRRERSARAPPAASPLRARAVPTPTPVAACRPPIRRHGTRLAWMATPARERWQWRLRRGAPLHRRARAAATLRPSNARSPPSTGPSPPCACAPARAALRTRRAARRTCRAPSPPTPALLHTWPPAAPRAAWMQTTPRARDHAPPPRRQTAIARRAGASRAPRLPRASRCAAD